MPLVSSATLRLWTHPSADRYLERFAVKSLIVLPVRHVDRVAGSIAVWREEPCAAFDEQSLALLENVARCISDLI
jgi:hypothetical protein